MNMQAEAESVDFGERLERECSEIVRSRPSTCEVALTCTAVRAQVPLPIASSLFVAAQILVRWAFEAVDSGPGGRIDVFFTATENAFELIIEHSHTMGRAVVGEEREDALLLRRVVARADGYLEALEVIGGCRWLVSIPMVGLL